MGQTNICEPNWTARNLLLTAGTATKPVYFDNVLIAHREVGFE
jgi:hypothetical protein